MTTLPDIVLIHGFWVTPRSWEHWIDRYEAAGHRVHAPAYPGFEVEVEALNADPAPIEAVTVPQIIDHLETVVDGLDSPPILIGHSAGGVFTQILLDHGFGAAGVAINSVGAELMATPAAPKPWSSRICVKTPPAEWPMMIGGESRSPTMASMLSMISLTFSCSIGVGSALRASTSTSKPG